MRLTARLLILCLSLLSLPTFAETLGNLYQVHEPVASQQPDERNAGLTRALQTLVQRLTGDSRGLQNPALAGYFKDPQQLISQYGYENGPPMALVVDFDPTATDNALRRAGLQVWGASRPSVLAWWLNEGANGSSLVGDSQEAAAPLNRAAQRRGLPLRLPIADLSEQQVGTAANLNAAQPDALKSASERYGADALLAVDAKEADGKWSATWHLWMGDSREQGQAQGDTPDALADAVMLGVSQRLSQRFVGGSAGAATAQVLQIEGANLARYAEVSRLLEPMGAKLVLVQGGKLVYNVTASPEQLRAQLALAHLQELPAEPAQPAVDANGQPVPNPAVPRANVLRFHW